MTDKLRGFLGFRGTAVVRVQANGTRFQQGRLLMNFFPQNDVNVARHDMVNFTSWGVNSLIYATQLPRVEFDPANDTDVMLKIPYITDNLYYNLLTGEGSAGIVNLIVYSPLLDVGGVGSIEYTIFVHFEDVELVYATYPSTLFTQSGRSTFGGIRASRTYDSGGNVPDLERKTARDGPVSSVLGTIANVADVLVDVPLLSSVAKTVTWVTGAAADVAWFFGFSKPYNIHSVQYVNNNPHRNAINCTGTDSSYNMGFFEDNSVGQLPGFAGTDIDEMNINHVIAIPAYWTSFTWSASDTPGTNLATYACDPSKFFQNTTASTVAGAGGVVGQHCIPLTYVSKLFTEYRGSIRFTFKLVKTEFHSGRLMIVFGAGIKGTSSIDYTNTAYTHREIVDIRESTEFTFVCPYASTKPYMSIPPDERLNSDYGGYGYITVFVLNTLIAPPSVTQSISMIVEVSAAEDFEFAVPAMLRKMPYIKTYPTTSPYPGPNPGAPPAVTQAGDTVDGPVVKSVHETKVDKHIGSSNMVSDNHFSSAACVGEKIVSFRSILRRSLAAHQLPADSGSTIMVAVPRTLMAGTPAASVFYDYFDFVSPLYGLFRGSMSIKRLHSAEYTRTVTVPAAAGAYTYDNSRTEVRLRVAMFTRPYATSGSNRPYLGSWDTYNEAITQPLVPLAKSMNEYPEWAIPYYSDRHVSVNCMPDTVNNLIGDYHRPKTVIGFKADCTGKCTNATKEVLSRCIGEDFSFGYFLGTVPLFPLSAGVTGPYVPTNGSFPDS